MHNENNYYFIFSSVIEMYNIESQMIWHDMTTQRCEDQTRLQLLIHPKPQFSSFRISVQRTALLDCCSAGGVQSQSVGKAHFWNVGLTLYLHGCELLYGSFHVAEASSHFENGFGLGEAKMCYSVYFRQV